MNNYSPENSHKNTMLTELQGEMDAELAKKNAGQNQNPTPSVSAPTESTQTQYSNLVNICNEVIKIIDVSSKTVMPSDDFFTQSKEKNKHAYDSAISAIKNFIQTIQSQDANLSMDAIKDLMKNSIKLDSDNDTVKEYQSQYQQAVFDFILVEFEKNKSLELSSNNQLTQKSNEWNQSSPFSPTFLNYIQSLQKIIVGRITQLNNEITILRQGLMPQNGQDKTSIENSHCINNFSSHNPVEKVLPFAQCMSLHTELAVFQDILEELNSISNSTESNKGGVILGNAIKTIERIRELERKYQNISEDATSSENSDGDRVEKPSFRKINTILSDKYNQNYFKALNQEIFDKNKQALLFAIEKLNLGKMEYSAVLNRVGVEAANARFSEKCDMLLTEANAILKDDEISSDHVVNLTEAINNTVELIKVYSATATPFSNDEVKKIKHIQSFHKCSPNLTRENILEMLKENKKEDFPTPATYEEFKKYADAHDAFNESVDKLSETEAPWSKRLAQVLLTVAGVLTIPALGLGFGLIYLACKMNNDVASSSLRSMRNGLFFLRKSEEKDEGKNDNQEIDLSSNNNSNPGQPTNVSTSTNGI